MKLGLLVLMLCIFMQGCAWMRLPDAPNYAPQAAVQKRLF